MEDSTKGINLFVNKDDSLERIKGLQMLYDYCCKEISKLMGIPTSREVGNRVVDKVVDKIVDK